MSVRVSRRVLVAWATSFVMIATAGAAMAVDTPSTTGYHIVAVPGGSGHVATEIADNGWIAMNPRSGTTNALLWQGTGEPLAFGTVAPDTYSLTINDLSDAGHVAGAYRSLSDGIEHPFVWHENTGVTDIPAPPEYDPSTGNRFPATGVDAAGWVVGQVPAQAEACYVQANTCGFLAQPGPAGYESTIFQQPSPLATFAVNDIELIDLGGVLEHLAAGFGLTWTPSGGFVPLPAGSASFGEVFDINGSGEMVGIVVGATVEAAYWASPTSEPTVIGTMGSDATSTALGINDAGQVVGWSGDTVEGQRAFLWEAGTGLVDLGSVAGAGGASAYDISNDGLVVGRIGNEAVIWDLDGDFTLPGGNLSPTIEQIPDQSVDELTRIVVTPVVTDPEGDPYTLSWSGVPEGSVINGIWDWTPTEAQAPATYQITVTATQDDDPTNSASETFVVTALEVNQSPMLEPIDNQSATVGQALEFAVTARDSDLPAQPLTFSVGGDSEETPPPDGASIDPDTGMFSWTPAATQTGDQTLTVAVSDGFTSASESFLVRVSSDSPNLPPVIQPIPDQTVDELTRIVIVPVVSDPEEDPLTLTWGGVPPGAIINGIYEWTPTEDQGPGVYEISLTATQDDDPTNTTTVFFTITVNEVPPSPADGIDATWIITYLDTVDDSAFRGPMVRYLLDARISRSELAARQGHREAALAIVDSLEPRLDGCGSEPDRNDWVVDCAVQVIMRDSLALYRHNVTTAVLPDPPWSWR